MQYIKENLGRALRTSPLRAPLKSWALVPVYCLFALVVGFSTGLLRFDPLDSKAAFLLPFTLLVFPSLLEEMFFRGILIPRNTAQYGPKIIFRNIALSTALFVLWHPANALAFNHAAIPIFLDPWFLIIVAALGVVCGYGYVVSRSIWVPVLIHWVTVLVWVLLLGGRNLVLEM